VTATFLFSFVAWDFLVAWFDRGAWVLWIVTCVCHIGASPLIKMPLGGLMPQVCESLWADGVAGNLIKAVCLEASTESAVMLVSVVIGWVSYPLLVKQLECLCRFLHLPEMLLKPIVLLVLVCFSGGVWLSGSSDFAGSMNYPIGSSSLFPAFVACVAMCVALVIPAIELVITTHRNHTNDRARSGIVLTAELIHPLIAARVEEVAALEMTTDWSAHYRRHSRQDAFWRFRRRSVRHHIALCIQASSLLAWGACIWPYCDEVLFSGTLANMAYLVYRLCVVIASSMQSGVLRGILRAPQVNDSESECECLECEVIPETQDEQAQRQNIELMRQAQEAAPSFSWLL